MSLGDSYGARTGLTRRRETFFNQLPKARVLDAALSAHDNPTPLFFLSTQIPHSDLQRVGFAIGRLGDDIERQYMINGEVAIFFAPWRDFQRRSFNAMTQGVQDLSKKIQAGAGQTERFTPSSKLLLLVSEDPQVESKIEEWQLGTSSPTLVISLPINDEDPEKVRFALLAQLRSRLGERDLYRTQNPVTGDDFFGRQRMLRDASAALESDENVVILGLRRSGKTSVLRELKRQMFARGTIVTLGDFQILDQENTQSFATSLCQNLIDDLRDARNRGIAVRIGDEREQRVEAISLPDLADRVKRTANRNPQIRFVLAVDEVESAARIAKTDPGQIRTLLAALRTAAQACPNVSLAFAGVANRMFRSTLLGSGAAAVDNPMFGQVTSSYITAFEENETGELLRKLGRPMFLDWSDEAVREVQIATGGMPYFVRHLASEVRNNIKNSNSGADFEMVGVSAPHVLAVLPVWREDAGHDWAQLVEALRLHYPEAADLLDPTLTSDELVQWIGADVPARDAADDLRQLGLLEKVDAGGTWRRSSSLEAIHNLLAERVAHPWSTNPSTSTEEDLLALVKRGEAKDLELKETFRINTHTEVKDQRMETAVVRAVVGLMNSDGGKVVVGVHDSGECKGLERDLKIFQGDYDRFERWILGDLLGKRVDASLVSQHVQLSWVPVRGVTICSLEIEKSTEPVYLDDSHLFVRTGNQTLELTGKMLTQFVRGRQ